ncbi:MAG: hypothetical protein CMC66_03435 [Flavobacteriaceae bacterium]|nr:hypothetical protein [Flavobacteriaceae bacterium]
MEKKNNRDALKNLEKFEKMIQEDCPVYLDLNDIEEIIIYYFHEANYDMAGKAINLANQIFPKSINISILSSEILLQQSKESEAYDLINDCLDLNSENCDLIFQKAKILNKLKKYNDSNNVLSKIKETSFLVDDLMLRNFMNLDQYSKSIKVVKKLILKFPDDKKYMDKLISCFRLSKMENKAIKFLNKFLAKYPYNQNAWFEIGKLYFDKKMIKESIASHEFSIICDETFSPSYVELGKIHEYNLDFNKAIYYYEILRSLDSVTSFSLYRLSFCYEKIGAYDESIKYLNEIISKDPLYEKAWISIAKHYLRENNHDKALENLNKALNIIANNY